MSLGNIVVVGAGLAGLALSLRLAEIGFEVDLVERRENWERRGSAFGLAPNGIKALQELCPRVMDKLREQGITIGLTGGLFLGWWLVRDTLLQEVIANQHITLHMGCRLESFDDETDPSCIKVNIVRQNGADGEDEFAVITLEGRLLVGADGVHSTVRTLLQLPSAMPSGKKHWRGKEFSIYTHQNYKYDLRYVAEPNDAKEKMCPAKNYF